MRVCSRLCAAFGGVLARYEWVTTDKFNPKDPKHQEIKAGIEIGNSLPDITDGEAVSHVAATPRWPSLWGYESAHASRPSFRSSLECSRV